ncbi:hypothetical protein [Streptomyces sp. NBC_01320]|uniref:hypothetical protein n=1 Tax=Streptomyces sp. NBC_01320 TaxID=2903824 RepID=UPI002E12E220
MAKPSVERRSFATARKMWPEIEVICASEAQEFDDCLKSISDDKIVFNTLVADLQRVIEYPALGFPRKVLGWKTPAEALNEHLTGSADRVNGDAFFKLPDYGWETMAD